MTKIFAIIGGCYSSRQISATAGGISIPRYALSLDEQQLLSQQQQQPASRDWGTESINRHPNYDYDQQQARPPPPPKAESSFPSPHRNTTTTTSTLPPPPPYVESSFPPPRRNTTTTTTSTLPPPPPQQSYSKNDPHNDAPNMPTRSYTPSLHTPSIRSYTPAPLIPALLIFLHRLLPVWPIECKLLHLWFHRNPDSCPHRRQPLLL